MKDIDTDMQDLVMTVNSNVDMESFDAGDELDYGDLTAALLAAGWVPPTCSRLALAALGAGDVGRATGLLTPPNAGA